MLQLNASAPYSSIRNPHLVPSDRQLLNIKYFKEQDLLVLKGWSISPELGICYKVIHEEIEEHLSESNQLTLFLAYNVFNSATAKFIFDTIKTLNLAHSQGKKVKIHWVTNVENQGMFETGLEFREFCEFDFFIQPA